MVAIYWDFENLHGALCDEIHGDGAYGQRKRDAQEELVDVSLVLKRMEREGDVIINRAYADWGPLAVYREQLLSNRFDLVQQFGGAGKNGADVQLAIEVVDDLHREPAVTTVAIVSGDGDLLSLARRVRRGGKRLLGVGFGTNSHRFLKAACDEFVRYDELRGPIERRAAAESHTSSSRGGHGRSRSGPSRRGSAASAPVAAPSPIVAAPVVEAPVAVAAAPTVPVNAARTQVLTTQLLATLTELGRDGWHGIERVCNVLRPRLRESGVAPGEGLLSQVLALTSVIEVEDGRSGKKVRVRATPLVLEAAPVVVAPEPTVEIAGAPAGVESAAPETVANPSEAAAAKLEAAIIALLGEIGSARVSSLSGEFKKRGLAFEPLLDEAMKHTKTRPLMRFLEARGHAFVIDHSKRNAQAVSLVGGVVPKAAEVPVATEVPTTEVAASEVPTTEIAAKPAPSGRPPRPSRHERGKRHEKVEKEEPAKTAEPRTNEYRDALRNWGIPVSRDQRRTMLTRLLDAGVPDGLGDDDLVSRFAGSRWLDKKAELLQLLESVGVIARGESGWTITRPPEGTDVSGTIDRHIVLRITRELPGPHSSEEIAAAVLSGPRAGSLVDRWIAQAS